MSYESNYFDASYLRLKSINYQVIDEIPGHSDVTFTVNDSFTILEQASKKLNLVCSRTISFVPKSMFNLQVDYEMLFELNESNNSYENIDQETIVGMINQTVLPSAISLVISNISSTEGRMPLVTQPVFMADQNLETQ